MLVLVGYLVVAGSVFGGYALMGGSFGVLYQPLELLIIGGAAVGAFIAANDAHTIVCTLKALPKLVSRSKNTTRNSTWSSSLCCMCCCRKAARTA